MRIAFASLTVGLSVALGVTILLLVDSNHSEPVGSYVERIGAVVLWVSLLALAWLLARAHLRRR